MNPRVHNCSVDRALKRHISFSTPQPLPQLTALLSHSTYMPGLAFASPLVPSLAPLPPSPSSPRQESYTTHSRRPQSPLALPRSPRRASVATLTLPATAPLVSAPSGELRALCDLPCGNRLQRLMTVLRSTRVVGSAHEHPLAACATVACDAAEAVIQASSPGDGYGEIALALQLLMSVLLASPN